MVHDVTMERSIQEGLDDERRRDRGPLILSGAFLGALGVIAILYPYVSTFAFNFVVGVLLILGGLTQLVRVARRASAPQRVWRGAMGAAWLLAGVLFVIAPVVGVISLTVAAAVALAADGAVRLFCAARQRDDGRFWLGVGGALSLALAILIAIELPETAFWVLGVLLGASLLVDAAVLIGAGLSRRDRAGP